jgi:hypothetical protein
VAGFGILNRIAYSKSWEYISPLVPKMLKSWAARLSKKAIDPNLQQPHIKRLRDEIRSDLLIQIEELSEIMGRDLTKVWQV